MIPVHITASIHQGNANTMVSETTYGNPPLSINHTLTNIIINNDGGVSLNKLIQLWKEKRQKYEVDL